MPARRVNFKLTQCALSDVILTSLLSSKIKEDKHLFLDNLVLTLALALTSIISLLKHIKEICPSVGQVYNHRCEQNKFSET